MKMVFIEDISSSFGIKSLEIVEDKRQLMEEDILLAAHPSRVDPCASSWQRLKTPFHAKESKITWSKMSEVWTIQATVPQHSDKPNYLLESRQSLIESKARRRGDASSWQRLKVLFHAKEFKVTLSKMPKMWTLKATIPQHLDKSSYLSGSSQSFIESEAKWEDALQFAGEFYFIKEIDSNSDVVKAFIEAWSSRPFNHQFKFHEDTSRVLVSDTRQVSFKEVDRQGSYILSTPESRASVEKFCPKSYKKWFLKVFYKNVPRLINLKMFEVQAQAKIRHERGKRKAALVLLKKSNNCDVDRYWKRRKEDDKFSREDTEFFADPQKEFFKMLWSRLFERMSGSAPDSVPFIEDEVQLVLEEAKYFDLSDVSSVEKS